MIKYSKWKTHWGHFRAQCLRLWFPPRILEKFEFPIPSLKNCFPDFVSSFWTIFGHKISNIWCFEQASLNVLYYHLSMVCTIYVKGGSNVCCCRQSQFLSFSILQYNFKSWIPPFILKISPPHYVSLHLNSYFRSPPLKFGFPSFQMVEGGTLCREKGKILWFLPIH